MPTYLQISEETGAILDRMRDTSPVVRMSRSAVAEVLIRRAEVEIRKETLVDWLARGAKPPRPRRKTKRKADP